MGLEKVFADSVSQDPECLPDGMAPFGPVGIGPEKLSHFVSGGGLRIGGHIDKEGEGFPQGQGNQVAILMDDLGGTKDTELMRQKNLRLDVDTSGVQSYPVPSG